MKQDILYTISLRKGMDRTTLKAINKQLFATIECIGGNICHAIDDVYGVEILATGKGTAAEGEKISQASRFISSKSQLARRVL